MSFMNEGEIDKRKLTINQEQTSTIGKVRQFFTVIYNDMKTHILGKE